MKKFTAGVICALALLAIVALVWFSLNDQTKGVVIGLLLGGVGMLCGVTMALAVVAIFLLYHLRWQVQGTRQQPPIIMGYPQPMLSPPQQEGHTTYPPPSRPAWDRPNRQFRILGEDDVEEEEDIPGTRPPGW